MKRVLKNSNFVFLSAMVFALIYPDLALYLKWYIIPALIIVTTVSLCDIKLRKLDMKKNIKPILVALMLNYVLLSGIVLIMSVLLIEDDAIFKGFIVMVATPPAIGVIAYSSLLKGDTHLALIANAFIYLLSIFLMPAILLLLLGIDVVDPFTILKILIILILLPLILSRIVIRTPYYERHKGDKDILINLGFFLVIYVVIGLNRDILLGGDYGLLLPIFIIGFMRTFFSSTLVFKVGRKLNIRYDKMVTYTLFSSYKNLGLTATISLILFGTKAAVPAAVCILLEVLLFIYYSALMNPGEDEAKKIGLNS